MRVQKMQCNPILYLLIENYTNRIVLTTHLVHLKCDNINILNGQNDECENLIKSTYVF